MFQDVLFAPPRNAGVKAAVLPLAALVHGLLALILVVIPLIRNGDLPRVELTGVFLAPPPPTPAAPPPKAKGKASAGRARIKPVAAAGTVPPGLLVAPVTIPTAINEEPLDWGGAGDGVDWGVDYGAASAYPKNLIGDALYQVLDANGVEPVRPAGGVKMPRLLKRVEPAYPEIARQARIQGTVILEAATDIYGRVASVKVLRSVPLLDGAAVDAVRQWLYEPMVVNGRPRGVVFTVTLRFELD
jgi:periplasmic protein TonB